MCRSIKTLFNFAPPATDDEVRAASLQFVRKLSGFNGPSKTNEAVFNDCVEQIFATARRLVDSLETTAPPKDREVEAAKAKARSVERFGERPAAPAAGHRKRHPRRSPALARTLDRAHRR